VEARLEGYSGPANAGGVSGLGLMCAGDVRGLPGWFWRFAG